ncbi:hypothetical protein IV500_18615 [Paeniglutamicibacter antarcticus]|uniref:Uncharacterized protein n=1 Tax=Arthrobacter terrae TaxID=2935737 RepID=A0A931CTZ8_9MICC|nr:hypothetical protein [Arthrobacter terrae]MBG0741379.1 hypothetical protein [Arthrobacter terrae]
MIRVGLRSILDAQLNISVVREAGDGLEAVRLLDEVAEERQPDADPAMAALFSALTPKERDFGIAIATGQVLLPHPRGH